MTRSGAHRDLVSPKRLPEAFAIDGDGTLWLAAHDNRSGVDFDGAPSTPSDSSYQIARFAEDGTFIESAHFDVGFTAVFAWPFAFDAAGNAYLGLTARDRTVSEVAPARVGVAKITSDLDLKFSKFFPSEDTVAYVGSLMMASDGDLLMQGTFDATLDFGATKLKGLEWYTAYSYLAKLSPEDGKVR